MYVCICLYIYICVCVCVNIKFKSTYFMSPNISLSTLTQCISSNNMFYNSFLFLTLFNYVFFLSNKTLIPSKKLKKIQIQQI